MLTSKVASASWKDYLNWVSYQASDPKNCLEIEKQIYQALLDDLSSTPCCDNVTDELLDKSN